jgi:PAS domain S-box-containing protein
MNEPTASLSQMNSHLEAKLADSIRPKATSDASEHFLHSALDALLAHVAILDETGTIITVNRAWRRFAETNSTNPGGLAEGANYLAVCDTAAEPDSEGAAEFAAGIRAVLQDAQDEFVLEYPCHSPTEKRWFIGRVTRFAADGGTCLVVAHENITERRLVEATLRESEERWKFALEGAGDGVWDWNAQTNEVFYSRQWKAMLGYEEDEIGNTLDEWDRRVHPEDKAECHADLQRHFKGETPVYQNQHRLLCRDGGYKWILDRGKVMEWSAEGKPLRVVGTHTDITERKQINEALREANHFLNNLIGYANAPIIVWDPEFRITRFNRAFEKLTGRTAREVNGKSLEILFPPDQVDATMSFIRKTQPNEHWETVEIAIQHADGAVRSVLWNSATIFAEDGITPVATIAQGHDITEQKKAEDDRERTIEELDRRRRELESLLYGANTVLEGADFAATARRIFDAACGMTGARSGYVTLLSESGEENEVLFLESGGLPSTVDPNLPMPVRGLRSEAYKTGRAVLDNDFMNSRWAAFMPKGHVDLQNVMFGPLNVQGKTVGIMGLANKPGNFTDDDRRMAEAFGQLAAIALENSRNREALELSEMRYRLLVENANEAILVIQDRRIRFLNHAASQIIGHPEDELLSQPFIDFVHREDRSMVLDHHVRRLRGETPPGRYSFRLVDKEGISRWVEVGAVLIEWEGRAATLNFVTDVNARKRAEEALREANEYLRNLITYANSPIIVWDPEYRITRFNRAFEKLTGRTFREVIGQSLEILFPPDQVDTTMSFIKKTQPHEHWETVEIGIQNINGSVRAVLWNSATIIGPDGITPVATIAQGLDITERKRAEEEKEKLQAQTWQLHKAQSLGRMAGAVAHHFNNQLQAVIGYLEMALDGLPPGNRPRTNVIEALKASHKASGISGMMLTYLGQNSGNRVPLDLSETCRRTLPMLRSAMQEGTVLEADLPCPGPVIKANAGQIQQVLANLIYNAMEAVGDEKGVIRVAVRTVSKAGIPTVQRFPIDWQPQDSPYACLEVADTGCGILGANLANIFDPFYSSKFTGRGLGLAVVFGIVRAHCGAVTVESDTGRGSVFRVFLPVCASQLDTHDPVGPSSPPLYKGDMG